MYNTVWTIINSSLRKFSKSHLLLFLRNLGVDSKRRFSDEHFNVSRSGKLTTMAENKFLLFPKLASAPSNPSLIYIRCLASDLKIIKRNFSTSECDTKEMTDDELTTKDLNVPNENQKFAPSRLYFLKEHTYNKNHLAFSLKQLKEKQPHSGFKLRYASERSDFGKHESRIFAKTIVNKVNYGHNILNFIKEDLLDIRTIKDKIKYEPKITNKEEPKSEDEPERIPVVKPPESKAAAVPNSSAVLVVPEKLPAVQTNSLEDALMWVPKV